MVRSTIATIAVALCAACATNPRPGVRAEYVLRAPPAERVEVIPAQPGPAYVWVRGRWGWRGTDYQWVSGRWAVPERGYHEWVAGRWEHARGGWYWTEGHWR